MHQIYEDIIGKLGDPQWWDEVGVPRYCTFEPSKKSNIYHDEVCLLTIECQACRRSFLVAMSSKSPSLADSVRLKEIHYGDPPNIQCCPAGPTMNSIPRRVEQYWRRIRGSWVRYFEFEQTIPCEDDKDGL